MLSPDNLVSDPTNTQAFNRYSYVWNNPMRYTDPSGNDLVGAVLGAIGNAVGMIPQVTTTASRFCDGTLVSSSTTGVSSVAQKLGGLLSAVGGFMNAISAGQAGKAAGDRVGAAMQQGNTKFIVHFNSEGNEVSRVPTAGPSQTYVNINNPFELESNYVEAPMPGVIKGYEDSKYQALDHQIAASTRLINAGIN
jgi:hypothetical protein